MKTRPRSVPPAVDVDPSDRLDAAARPQSVLEVFWRPGCPYCAQLRQELDRRGVPGRWRNIWTDPKARAIVRAANAGNETVPTVRIGGRTMTNPTWADLAPLLGDKLRTTGPTPHHHRRHRSGVALLWLLIAALEAAGRCSNGRAHRPGLGARRGRRRILVADPAAAPVDKPATGWSTSPSRGPPVQASSSHFQFQSVCRRRASLHFASGHRRRSP